MSVPPVSQTARQPVPAIGFLQVALRWWDRWLKGIENGAEADPAYRAYMLHSAPPDACAEEREGHWVAETVWPSPQVKSVSLHLVAEGGLSAPQHALLSQSASPRGYLKTENRGDFSAVVSTPQHLGMQAGEFFPMGLNGEMPGDQSGEDLLSLCFDAGVLEAPLELLGAAKLVLRLSSDKPLAFVVARLCDVAPDGSSVRIAHGLLNLCHREDREDPSPLVPGEEVEVAFLLDQMAYLVAAGHRLRLALSTTYWPFVWPSPEAATLTITGGHLELPVRQGPNESWAPPAPEMAKPWHHRVLRKGKTRRFVEQDLISGTQALVVEDDLGEHENLTHGLCTAEAMSERWQIRPDDPLSAMAEHRWEQRLWRGNWSVRTEAWARMTATATHLVHEARLTAWEGEKEVFSRAFREDVPRHFV